MNGFDTHRSHSVTRYSTFLSPASTTRFTFSVRGRSWETFLCGALGPRAEPIRTDALSEQKRVPLRPGGDPLCTVPRCFGRVTQGQKGPSRAMHPTMINSVYFSGHILRDSGTRRSHHKILWTSTASEMMIFSSWRF